MNLATRNRIEHQIVLEETIYTMPNWIVEDIAFRRQYSKSQISQMCQTAPDKLLKSDQTSDEIQHFMSGVVFRLDCSALPKIAAFDAQNGNSLSKSNLKRIFLEKKSAAHWRRKLMVAVAQLQTIDLRNDADETSRSQVLKILNDTIEVEAEALKIWNKFVGDCEVPSGFLISSRSPLSLYELMVLRSGNFAETRQEFANQYPWVTRKVLKSKTCHRKFLKVDSEPNRLDKFAGKFLCCEKNKYCLTARNFATKLNRNQNLANSKLDQLLNDQKCRLLVLHMHDDNEELITNIGQDVNLVSRQFKWATAAGDRYRLLLQLSVLIVRMMVRDGINPDDRILPEEIHQAFIGVSKICLARLIEIEQGRSTNYEFFIEEGARALANFIGKSNPPLLTFCQLIEFVKGVNQYCEKLLPDCNIDSSWPAPTAWDSTIQSRLSRIEVNAGVLTDKESLRNEGKTMKHCLSDDRIYHHPAVLGESVLFSIRAKDGRATLMLRPIFSDDGNSIINWESTKFDLEGKRNTKPSVLCKTAAKKIKKYFKQQCPSQLKQEEIERVARIQPLIEQEKYYIRNESEATSHWDVIRTKYLPRSFSETCLESVIDEYSKMQTEKHDSIWCDEFWYG